MGLEKVPEVLHLTVHSHTFNFPSNEASKLGDAFGDAFGSWLSRKIDQVFDKIEQYENSR